MHVAGAPQSSWEGRHTDTHSMSGRYPVNSVFFRSPLLWLSVALGSKEHRPFLDSHAELLCSRGAEDIDLVAAPLQSSASSWTRWMFLRCGLG